MFSKLILLFGIACLARAACRPRGVSLESGKEYRIDAIGNYSGRLTYGTKTLMIRQTADMEKTGEPDKHFWVEPEQKGAYVVKTAQHRGPGRQDIMESFLQADPPTADQKITLASNWPGTAFEFKPIEASLENGQRSKCFNIVHAQTGLAWTAVHPKNWFEPVVQLGRFDAENKDQQFCFS